MRYKRTLDVGERHGELTIIKRVEGYVDKGGREHKKFLCQCSCGKFETKTEHTFHYVEIPRCNECYRKYLSRSKLKDLTGLRFGKWTVIRLDRTGRNPYWLCKCDCGAQRSIIGNDLRRGFSKGCRKCSIKRGKDHPRWKGFYVNGNGYIKLRKPEHPNAHQGYVSEHVFVMSEFLGRPIDSMEMIHHKNGKKDDNRLENLELWVKKHPIGQRMPDLVRWATDLLKKYAPEKLK